MIGLTCAGTHNSRLTDSVNVVDDDDKVAENLGDKPILIALPDKTEIVAADWYDPLAGFNFEKTDLDNKRIMFKLILAHGVLTS